MIAFIMSNWRGIVGLIAALVLAVAVWWYGFHNPAVIESQAKQIAEITSQRDNAIKAITLLEKIQKEKGKIDVQTFKNIYPWRGAASRAYVRPYQLNQNQLWLRLRQTCLVGWMKPIPETWLSIYNYMMVR
jgi:hypothetical protein